MNDHQYPMVERYIPGCRVVCVCVCVCVLCACVCVLIHAHVLTHTRHCSFYFCTTYVITVFNEPIKVYRIFKETASAESYFKH